MQSGTGKGIWVLEDIDGECFPGKEPLMGWNKKRGTEYQTSKEFSSLEKAIDYCKKTNRKFNLIKGTNYKPNIRACGYADNFLTNRRFPWSH